MQELLARLGIRSNMTSGFHPQANRQTERANQEIEKYLRLYVTRRQNDWSTYLPLAKFSINSRVASAHGMSPFEVVYSYQPHFNVPIGTRVGVADVDERVKIMEDVRRDITAGLEETKRRMKEQFEEGKRSAHKFEPGDWVYLHSKDIKVQVPSRKLADTYLGPYRVAAQVGDLDYQLELPISMNRVHNTLHVDKLFPWRGSAVNGEQPPEPGPVELEEEDDTGVKEFEVAGITDSRYHYTHLQYWVEWKGYGREADSWVWAADMESPALVKKYHQMNPDAPGPELKLTKKKTPKRKAVRAPKSRKTSG